jgi:hypothetical protein
VNDQASFSASTKFFLGRFAMTDTLVNNELNVLKAPLMPILTKMWFFKPKRGM